MPSVLDSNNNQTQAAHCLGLEVWRLCKTRFFLTVWEPVGGVRMWNELQLCLSLSAPLCMTGCINLFTAFIYHYCRKCLLHYWGRGSEFTYSWWKKTKSPARNKIRKSGGIYGFSPTQTWSRSGGRANRSPFLRFPIRKDRGGWSNECVAPAYDTGVERRRQASTELQHVTHFHMHPSR